MNFESYLKTLEGRRVAVVGVGVSNQPLIRLLLERGIDVTACDKRTDLGDFGREAAAAGCKFQLGEGYLHRLDQDVIFRSPGIRPDLPEFLTAIEKGSVLTSEMEVFCQVCPCPMIAVTGSDGKTTTTTILAEILRRTGRTVHLGGNIGHPLLAETPAIQSEDLVVLELSSFQLMQMQTSPHIAVTTNLSPNHLDVHKDYQEYIDAKANIFTHQSREDIAVFNADDPDSVAQAAKAPGQVRWFSRRKEVEEGAFLRGNAVIFRKSGAEWQIMTTEDIKIPGLHNIENYLAAVAALDDLVCAEQIRSFARSFGGVEHRIELVRTRRGVRWYNDSIASSPSRTIAGLRSFSEKVILIAGGKDKGISYEELGPVINDHVKCLILCGATAGVIRESVEQAGNFAGLEILETDDYRQAVALADHCAAEGDVVLLSPASTSFDRFANFMERGRVFKAIVNTLEE